MVLIFVNLVLFLVLAIYHFFVFGDFGHYYFILVLTKLFILELDIAICRIFDFNFSNKD
jgi:hypothetical protein